jgi:hypothetical protein
MQENIFTNIARTLVIILFSFIGYPLIFVYAANIILDAKISITMFNIISTGILFFIGGGIYRFFMYMVGYKLMISNEKEEDTND